MAAKTTPAPVASSAREIDLADNATSEEARVIGCHNLADKLVTGYAGEAVVAPEQFKICIADSGAQKANDRMALRPAWLWKVSDRSAPFFKVDRNHAG
jgi:hypothetical protein